MSFVDLTIKSEYRNQLINVVEAFYTPVLQQSVLYCRSVGFFSSSSLVRLSYGLSSLYKNHGRMLLVASPRLSEEDIEAIKKGYEEKAKIIKGSLARELLTHENYFDKERLNLLANMIAEGFLDINIALVKNKKTEYGIYHEKLGLMKDNNGNKIAFSGSLNESVTAIDGNYETIDVFCDWKNEVEREKVINKEKAFSSIWKNEDIGLEVYRFPELKEEIINRYKYHAPNVDIDEEELKRRFKPSSGVDFPIGETPEQESYVLNAPVIPANVTLHDYQKDAIKEWQKQDYRGIFDMATGTGKTYTGLGAIATLSKSLKHKLAVIIACPYKHLVEQWAEDIKRFGMSPIIGYGNSTQKNWKVLLDKAIRDQRIRNDKAFFCLVTTNATFSSKFVQDQIAKIGKNAPVLLVVDEAHNFGAPKLSRLLDDRFTYRLALSATLERHGDVDGTQKLIGYFGKKCIEYDLERAIREGYLTKYKYFPVLVYLNRDELEAYQKLSYEIKLHTKKTKTGEYKLDTIGEQLAYKRARLIAGVSGKLEKLREVITPYKDKHFLLVYCGATNVDNENKSSFDDPDEIKQITSVTKLLGEELCMDVAKFTAEEDMAQREAIKEHFKKGDDLQAIVAIKCLDEGVNIPGIRTAFILASTTNPKEYIQRRGRVLRLSPETGKEFAEIYDFVTLPRPLEDIYTLTETEFSMDMALVRSELKRMIEFGRLSMDSITSRKLIWDIESAYDIDEETLLKEV